MTASIDGVSRDEVVLHGGVANAGAVVRAGNHVLRPSNEFSVSILTFLSALAASGFDGAPVPVALEEDGRERLRFIEGDVPVPPYPDWAQSDEVLVSATTLIRKLHDASQRVDTTAMTWSSEMADPEGGPVALLDFDFAAPGQPTFDLAAFARMCVPVDDDITAEKLGWQPADRPGRLRAVCDTYGLDADCRARVLRSLSESIARGGEFVRRGAAAGEPGFVTMWADIGGMERFDRRRRWWADERRRFQRALL